MLRHTNDMWSNTVELFKVVSCLVDSNIAGHDPVTCVECSHLDTRPRGEVTTDIPV